MSPAQYSRVTKRQLGVITWTDELVLIRRNRVPLEHLVGSFYGSRIGYMSLLRLGYAIFFQRHKGVKGGRVTYCLMKQANAHSEIRSRTMNAKGGMLGTKTRDMSLRILLKQIPRDGAINVPLHRYYYRLLGVCLIDATGMIIAVDSAIPE